MKKQARVLKCGRMLAMLAGMAIVPFVMLGGVSNVQAQDELMSFALPSLKAEKMPPVIFKHSLHEEALDGDCSVCHTESDYFLDSENKSPEEVVAYVHDGCVSCHAEVASDKPTAPLLASCRSCHDADAAEAFAKEAAK